MMKKVQLIGFDADDTLWKSEDYYRLAEHNFLQVIGQYVDISNENNLRHLLAVERKNLKIFGYGVKGMTLSMLETAIELTEQKITAKHLQDILDIGHATLKHPVELIAGIRSAVEIIAKEYPVVLITKGDLFHQEAKIKQSGLEDLFPRIEIVSEKDAGTYFKILNEFNIQAAEFIMVGNSLRSDIEPVIQLGGWGIHVPYHVTWELEKEHGLDENEQRLFTANTADELYSCIKSIENTIQ